MGRSFVEMGLECAGGSEKTGKTRRVKVGEFLRAVLSLLLEMSRCYRRQVQVRRIRTEVRVEDVRDKRRINSRTRPLPDLTLQSTAVPLPQVTRRETSLPARGHPRVEASRSRRGQWRRFEIMSARTRLGFRTAAVCSCRSLHILATLRIPWPSARGVMMRKRDKPGQRGIHCGWGRERSEVG